MVKESFVIRMAVHLELVEYATPKIWFLKNANRELYEGTGLPLTVDQLFADPVFALNKTTWSGDVYFLDFPEVNPLGTFNIRDALSGTGYEWADTYQALAGDALLSGDIKLRNFVLPRRGINFLEVGDGFQYTPILYSGHGPTYLVGVQNRQKGNFAGYLVPAIKK